MQLRRARPEDYAAVGEVTVAAYDRSSAGAEDVYIDQLRDAEARDREAELWVAVGRTTATVLGTRHALPRRARRGARSASTTRASSGCSRSRRTPRARASARRWRGSCIDRFREEGAVAVVLSSTPEMAAAHRLYERLGFGRAPSGTGRRCPAST